MPRDLLGDQTVDVSCGNCGRRTRLTVRWLEANTELRCECGAIVALTTQSVRDEIAKVARTIEDIEARIRLLKGQVW
jgi:hypothetical protein